MKKVIAGLTLVLSLTACGASNPPPGEEDYKDGSEVSNYQKGISGDEFYTVDLDGQRCAVYNGESKGGIDCWPINQTPAPAPLPSPSYSY